MAEPIIENVALELVSRLGTILKANGHPFDVTAVNRPTRRMADILPEHLSIFVFQGDATRIEDMDYPGNPPAMAYGTEFLIYGFVRQSTRDDLAYDQEVNRMQAAIQKAICSDSSWYTFGSNAIDAEFGDFKRFGTDQGDHQGVTLSLTVRYRFSELDQYEARP